ncbi:hypothetical protein UlMin_030539 [Ulmus minor]
MEDVYFDLLPEGCIATIISLTTPRDACRLCLVSRILRSAAESDAVWELFLPPDYSSIISSSPASLSYASKKDLYFSLCDQPLLIDQGRKSFTLEKESGKKYYMLSARDLAIIWVDIPMYWRWIPYPGARFENVAELINVCWLEIHGRINTSMLSQSTLYAAYIVFKATMNAYGFEHLPVEAAVGVIGGETRNRIVFLDSDRGRRPRYQIEPRQPGRRYRRHNVLHDQSEREEDADNVLHDLAEREEDADYYPKERADGWLEVELGEFYCNAGEEGELEMSMKEISRVNWKSGLIVQGIEIRPKKINNGKSSL